MTFHGLSVVIGVERSVRVVTETLGCSYEAVMCFSRLKVLAVLADSGDVDRHGSSEADGWAPMVHDLATPDRLEWIAAQQALAKMAVDDPDTVELLRGRLQAAVFSNAGEFSNWRRFTSHGVLTRHNTVCLFERYDRGRERLYREVNGVVVVGMECECDTGN